MIICFKGTRDISTVRGTVEIINKKEKRNFQGIKGTCFSLPAPKLGDAGHWEASLLTTTKVVLCNHNNYLWHSTEV